MSAQLTPSVGKQTWPGLDGIDANEPTGTRVELRNPSMNKAVLSSRYAPCIADLDPRSAVAVALHELEQGRRVSRV
jgi:hypothetical protein